MPHPTTLPASLRKVGFAVLITLATLLSGSCATSRKSVSQLEKETRIAENNNRLRHDYFFHEGVQQTAEQNYAEAFELMQYCINADSTSSAAKYQLAIYYMLLGDKSIPEKLLSQAVAQEPDNYWFRHLLATQYQLTHQQGYAIQEYEDMIRRFPQRTELLLELAEMYDEIGQYEKELHVINRYGRLEDVYDQLNNQRFLCYLQMEEYDSAYYEIAPLAAETMEALMKSVNNSFGLDMVMKFCSVVEKHNPSLWQTYSNLAVANYQLRKPDEAFAIITRGLKNVTDSIGLASLYSLRGEFHHEMGRLDLTYQDYDSALMYNPKEIGILNNYAYFLSLEKRDLNRALEMSSITLQIEPENPTYLDTYAWILFRLSRYNEALKYILLAIENGGDEHPDVVEHCGDIYYNCGDKDKALQYWHAAVRLNSQSKLIQAKILQEKYIE